MSLISGKAKLAGVMGRPIAHSRSPRLHNYWLQQYQIDGAYVPLPVFPENLEQALKSLPALGFRGVNLTIPHKEAAIKHVKHLDLFAQHVGAVNTVVVRSDGELEGMNTDTYGFSENVRAAGYDFESGPVVLLGAGGAARAIMAALIAMRCPQVIVINRTPERAEALITEIKNSRMQARTAPWELRHEILSEASLLVNSTALGMNGFTPLDIDLTRLPTAAWVTDCVYNPLQTPLLAAAAARGNRVVDGLGMLFYQAIPGFEAWFGVEPKITPELRALMSEGL